MKKCSEDTTLNNQVEKQSAHGLLLVISGPSGVGKDSILRRAAKRLPNLRRSISATTRPPRPKEKDGEDYFFLSPEEFEQKKDHCDFLEWALYLDYGYGTPKSWVAEQLQQGKEVALEIDVQGAQQIRAQFPEAVLIFVAPPDEQALRERLLVRNTETEATIARRLRAYHNEIKCLPAFDYLIINDDLSEAVEQFYCIVRAEKARVKRASPHV